MRKHRCLAPRAAVAIILAAWGTASFTCDAWAAEAKRARRTKTPQCKSECVAGLNWYTDYYEAYRAAASGQGWMLLVNVTPCNGPCSQQQSAEQAMAAAPLADQLKQVVRLRVPTNATIDVDGKPVRLLSYPAFSHLQGGAGFVLIDLANKNAPYYGDAVSALPFASGKYYHWRPDHLSVMLNLPPGTITQRTMIWAVRIHPERPQSTHGHFNPGLAAGAAQHASYQASVGQQGHQNFGSRMHHLTAASGAMGVSEVCAESWPGQNMIDSCIDCVDSWRHSSGHWRGVSNFHRSYGYDISLGRNGIWYGTGIFGD
jgi:hypothetical protein